MWTKYRVVTFCAKFMSRDKGIVCQKLWQPSRLCRYAGEIIGTGRLEVPGVRSRVLPPHPPPPSLCTGGTERPRLGATRQRRPGVQRVRGARESGAALAWSGAGTVRGRRQLLMLCRAGRRAEERSRAPRPHHSWGWQPNLGHFTLTEGSPVPTASCSGEALPSGVTCVPDDRIFARQGEGQLDSVYVSHEILILLILLV